MSDTLVDRIGRALATTADDPFEENREFWRGYALAALRAIREPTPGMIANAWARISADKKAAGIARLGPGAGFVEWWQAAIDAAIAEAEAEQRT